MHGLPGTANTNRIILTLSIVVSLAGILLPRFHFGEHEALSPSDTSILPSSSFKERNIKPEVVIDGVPVAEIQPVFNPLEDVIFFSHIPRTAGGTFSLLLDKLFSDAEQTRHSGPGSAVKDLAGYYNLTKEDWRRIRVLYVHEDFSFIEHIPKHAAVTVFLRDPIKHRRSAYYWGLLQPMRAYDDITSWAVSADYPDFYQVEWVAGVSRWWPYSHYPEEFSLRVWNNKPLMLRLAKENLARTTWFGFTERYNESICLFYYTHRMQPKVEGRDYTAIHRKVTKGSSGDVGMIASAADYQKPRLEYEYKFIRWATKLFELRLAAMREDYRLHGKLMKEYIAAECRGVLT